MYLKLALRNARRSFFDYLLYILTLTILISVMAFSQYIAMVGTVQAGLKTASLPMLITIILVVLVEYMNLFLLKQRSKEFANYLLLGMEKNSLTRMFLFEFYLIGSGCFIVGCLLGLGIYRLLFSAVILAPAASLLKNLPISGCIGKTFLYFCVVELFSTIRIQSILRKTGIGELMITKKRNQRQGGKQQFLFLSIMTVASLASLTVLLCGIAFLPQESAFMITSFIAVPLLLSIFFFYKWLFQLLSLLRLKAPLTLLYGDRLYITASITSGNRTGAVINGVFSMCLTFSAICYIFGIFMLSSCMGSDNRPDQLWMGFLQISICVIFLVIYFSMLSLQQIIALRQNMADMRLLHYMGKNMRQLHSLVRIQIGIKLILPAIMCLVIFLISVPLLNSRLNAMLPFLPQNMLVKSACGFLLCFLLLYLCYFLAVCATGNKYMKDNRSKGTHDF